MPGRSLQRIALTRLFVSGCAVVFGACVLIERAQAEHGGGGGGIPVRTPSGRPYAMPQPRYKPLLPAPSKPQHRAPFRDIALRRQ
jgi:hypothetical protein